MNNNRNIKANEEEIDLLELFLYLVGKWKQILLGLIVGAILLGGYTYIQTPEYKSESMLYILSKTTSITSVADLQLGDKLSQDFVVIATSKPVLDTAIETVREDSGIVLTREDINKMITVTNKDDTRVLVIEGIGEDPQLVCDVTNAVTEATAEQMATIMKSDPPTTVERAEVATEPVDKGLTKKVGIGGLAGLVIVAILCAIPFLTNDRIQTPEEVERYLECGVLGTIPMDKDQVHKGDKRSSHKKKHKKHKKKK